MITKKEYLESKRELYGEEVKKKDFQSVTGIQEAGKVFTLENQAEDLMKSNHYFMIGLECFGYGIMK